MKINKCIDEVFKKHWQIKAGSVDPSYEPKIAIYMDGGYWQECMSEIDGQVSGEAYEFYVNNTLLGYDVWKVYPMRREGREKRHQNFNIVDLGA